MCSDISLKEECLSYEMRMTKLSFWAKGIVRVLG